VKESPIVAIAFILTKKLGSEIDINHSVIAILEHEFALMYKKG
jgi:hypothetical protein